jgi:hypothetical protein
MIAFLRGTLLQASQANGTAHVALPMGDAAADVPTPAGSIQPGDDVAVARVLIRVGTSTIDRHVLLGPWVRGWESDPPDLRSMPVVVLPMAGELPVALAGVRRAGRGAGTGVLSHGAPALGLRVLDAARDGAEVIVIEGGGRPHLWLARMLGGRPISALPLERPERLRSLFEGLQVDVDVPVPAADGARRSAIHTLLAPLALEATHQLVEVDPTPAFDELGLGHPAATLDTLAAGAAGVLAGRMAAGNRRWRAQIEE